MTTSQQHLTEHERVGRYEEVQVGACVFIGRVYHVRTNGWACIEQDDGHIASGPAPRLSA